MPFTQQRVLEAFRFGHALDTYGRQFGGVFKVCDATGLGCVLQHQHHAGEDQDAAQDCEYLVKDTHRVLPV